MNNAYGVVLQASLANKLATGVYVALPNITRSSVDFQVGYMELQLVITLVNTV